MKYLKEYNNDYYDADKEFENLLKNTLSDARYSLLDVEDLGVIKKFSFKFISSFHRVEYSKESMLGGYEWNPKMGDASFDKYIQNCLLSASSIFNIRKFMYGDLDEILILEILLQLPAERIGRRSNLIKNTELLQLILDSINKLGYEYYLDFNSISSNPNEKPLTIKIIVKPEE